MAEALTTIADQHPEFSLIALCCAADPPLDAIRAAAGVVEWDRVLQLAERHRVVALVHHALRLASVALPNTAQARLTVRAQASVRAGLAQAAETVRLHQRLTAAGIRAVFVKGATLAQLAYRDLGRKGAKDIDLYIEPTDLPATIQALRADGYSFALARTRPTLWLQRFQFNQVEGVHARTGIQLEVHWRVSRNPGLLPSLGAAASTQPVVISGVAVPTFVTPDLLAYLAVHGGLSGWARLKWLADFDALLHGLDDEAMLAAARHADALGAGTAFAQGLVLRERLLRRPVPPALAPACRRPAVQRAVAYATRLLLNDLPPPERRFGAIDLVLNERLVTPGWRGAAQHWRSVGLRVAPSWLATRVRALLVRS